MCTRGRLRPRGADAFKAAPSASLRQRVSGLLFDGTPGDGARAGGRVGDLDPAGLRLRRSGNGDAQDAIGIVRRKVVQIHALTQRELPGERALRSLGDDDVLAVAVARGTFGLDRQRCCARRSPRWCRAQPRAGRPRRDSCRPWCGRCPSASRAGHGAGPKGRLTVSAAAANRLSPSSRWPDPAAQ